MPSLVLIGFTVSVRDAVKDRGFPSKHQPALNYIALSCMYVIYIESLVSYEMNVKIEDVGVANSNYEKAL